MAYSYNVTIAGGSTNLVAVPFGYLDKSHVHVFLNGVQVPDANLTWNSATQIALPSIPAAGTAVRVQRVTPVNALVTFVPGNLDPTDLNNANLQALYVALEADDSSAGALPLNPDNGQWDGGGKRLTALADPVNLNDAVTRGWLADTYGSSIGTQVAAAADSEAAAAAAAAQAAFYNDSAAATLVAATAAASTATAAAASAAAAVVGAAPLASPAFTGNPTAPTPTAGDNDTSLATTAFVTNAVGGKANLGSPAFTGAPTAPTATAGTNTTQLATTAFVAAAFTALLNGVSSGFDTLSEIATELGLKAYKAITMTAGSGLTGGGDLSANRTFAIDKAATSDVRAKTSNKVVTSDNIFAAAAFVDVTFAATTTFDFSTGLNFTLGVLTANLTVATPTNLIEGQSGTIYFKQDATGGRTVTLSSAFKGSGFTMPTAAGARAALHYKVDDGATQVIYSAQTSGL